MSEADRTEQKVAAVMLRAEALTKGFTLHLQGGVRIPVLAGVGLDLHVGECIALSGPSGAGKSTLMRSLYGNYRAESGRILVRKSGTEPLIRVMAEGEDEKMVRAVVRQIASAIEEVAA